MGDNAEEKIETQPNQEKAEVKSKPTAAGEKKPEKSSLYQKLELAISIITIGTIIFSCGITYNRFVALEEKVGKYYSADIKNQLDKMVSDLESIKLSMGPDFQTKMQELRDLIDADLKMRQSSDNLGHAHP